MGLWIGATIFVSCYQLGAGKSGFYLEFAALGLIVSVVLYLKNNFYTVYEEIKGAIRGNELLVGVNLLYILWDLTTWLYGSDRAMVFSKYNIVFISLLVGFSILIYVKDEQTLKKVKLWIGLPSFALAVVTIVNFYIPIFYPVYYALRLSLRTDYNMYATAVYLGGVTWVAEEAKRENIPLGRFFLQFTVVGLFIGILLLTGSRRILVVLPMWVLSFIMMLSKQAGAVTKDVRTGAALILGGIIVISSVSVFVMNTIAGEMNHRFSTEKTYGIAEQGGSTSYAERIESTTNRSLSSKRIVIWQLALEEIKSLEGIQLAIGRGGGASIRMYDAIEAPLDAAYPDKGKRIGSLSPHNMILADIIDGGIVKLVLCLGVLLVLFVSILEFWIKEPVDGRLYILAFITIVLGSMISGKFGLIHDRYYYLFLAILIAEKRLLGGTPKDA